MNEVPPGTVCLDASVVVRWLLDREISHVASLEESEHQFVTPSLMRYEVTNALYQITRAGGLSVSTAEELLDVLVTLPIELVDTEHLHQRALSIAHQYRSGAAYDAHYVALAQHLGAELWTADKRLYNAVHHQLGFVHLID